MTGRPLIGIGGRLYPIIHTKIDNCRYIEVGPSFTKKLLSLSPNNLIQYIVVCNKLSTLIP